MTQYEVVLERVADFEVHQVTGPAELHKVAWELVFRRAVAEKFVVFTLDAQRNVTGFRVISSGGLCVSVVEPRAVFQFATLSNAHAIIFAHNHPSGHPEPSREDVKITERLKACGELMGIPLLDHIIAGSETAYLSMAEGGLL